MKKYRLALALVLTLCLTAVSALAAEPTVYDETRTTCLDITEDQTILLKNVNIDGTTAVNTSAISVLPGVRLTILLADGSDNTLISYSGQPGIKLGSESELIITCENAGKPGHTCGKLTVESTGVGAGIGSINGYDMDSTITISCGVIEATGLSGAAGIGGGNGGSLVGTVNITGGTVTATGGNNGAGIGSGTGYNMSGEVNITGGTVTATGSGFGAGIGSGYQGNMSGKVSILGKNTVVTATGGGYGGAGIGSAEAAT